jgi:hypothetical protein
LSSPEYNIGHLNDGLLNGEGGYLTSEELKILVDESDWYDVPDVEPNYVSPKDPGWIHLANIQEGEEPEYSSSTVLTAPDGSTFNPAKVLKIEDLLKIDLSCSPEENCTSGTWSLMVFPETVQIVQEVLGRNAFDHLAFVFKAGNSGNAETEDSVWIYDFNFKVIAQQLAELAGKTGSQFDFDFQTAYTLSGNWNMVDFQKCVMTGPPHNQTEKCNWQEVSHLNIWTRDPMLNDISTPAPFALLLFGGVIPVLLMRRRYRHTVEVNV